jgi:ribonucleoside-diphosphate reductase alpha chain
LGGGAASASAEGLQHSAAQSDAASDVKFCAIDDPTCEACQ